MTTTHDARNLPEPERIDYLTVVASMLAADGVVDDQELAQLRTLCEALELSAEATESVVAGAGSPDAEHAQGAMQRLAGSTLRFTLMTDAIFMAYADGQIVEEEEATLKRVGGSLSVSDAQRAALRSYVEVVRDVLEKRLPPHRAQVLIGPAAAAVGAVDVPPEAVAVSGSVHGLGAAGIGGGLASLGGAGQLGGPSLGPRPSFGSYKGVAWLSSVADAASDDR